jgi:hypothetical protein
MRQDEETGLSKKDTIGYKKKYYRYWLENPSVSSFRLFFPP